MKKLLVTLLLLASNSAIADDIFVDQINGIWAYVCQSNDNRWTCKDVHIGALSLDYGIDLFKGHGWFFDVTVQPRREK